MQNLLIVPFIILPLLMNTDFSDPTLIVRRTTLFVMLFAILSIFQLYKIKVNNISKTQIIWVVLFLSYLLFCLITSYFVSQNFTESLWGIIYMLGWLCVSITFFLYAQKINMSNILVATSYVGGIISLLSLFQAFNLLNIENLSSTTGSFFNRNFWGMYLCFLIPASAYSIVKFDDFRNKTIHILLFTFSFCSLIHCRSRAAWLAIFSGFILLLIIHHKSILNYLFNIFQGKANFKILLIFPMLVLFFILLEPTPKDVPDYKKSIFSTLTSSTKDNFNNKKNISTIGQRYPLYETTLNMIKDYTFFGVGYNNWRIVNPKYYGKYIHDENYLKINQRPHNDLLWVAAESGIVGLLIFMLCILFPLLFTFKKIIYKKQNKNFLLESFLMISVLIILVESLFDFPKQRTMANLYMWSYIGFLTKNLSDYKIKINNLIVYSITICSLLIACLSYMNYQSIINSQKMLIQKKHEDLNLSIKHGLLALRYGKNVDNTGTPIKFNLGVLEYQKGDIIRSKNYFEEALKVHPYHIGILENLMIINAKNNNYTEANKLINMLNELFPYYYSPIIKLIKIHLQKGNINEAKTLMETTNFEHATPIVVKSLNSLRKYINLISH